VNAHKCLEEKPLGNSFGSITLAACSLHLFEDGANLSFVFFSHPPECRARIAPFESQASICHHRALQ
jgi:hypothetical protein